MGMKTQSVDLESLRGGNDRVFEIAVDRTLQETLASDLGLLGLRKLRATATLHPQGRKEWHLTMVWGATVIQP